MMTEEEITEDQDTVEVESADLDQAVTDAESPTKETAEPALDDEGSVARARGWVTRSGLGLTVGILILCGLIAYGVLTALDLRSAQADGGERAEAVAVAEDAVVNLTTLSAKTSDRDINRLLGNTAPGFKADLEAMVKALKDAITTGEVTATGEVVASGIESATDDKVVALVAASGTVENVNTSEPEPRHYRLRVTVDTSGDKPLISGIEFVA